MCSIFYVGRKGLYKGIQVVVDKLGNPFSGVVIAGYDGSAGVALFMHLRYSMWKRPVLG